MSRVTPRFLVWCCQQLRECRRKSSSGENSMFNIQHDELEVSVSQIQGGASSGQSDLSLKLRHLGIFSITKDCGIRLQKGRGPYLTELLFGGSVDKFVIPSGPYFLGHRDMVAYFFLYFLRTLAKLNILSPVIISSCAENYTYGTLFTYSTRGKIMYIVGSQ